MAEGIDRVRLEVRAGSESPADSFGDWARAGFPASGAAYALWRARRYETINDDANPLTFNAAGFHFSELDDTIDTLVTPLRQRLAARGESLYVNLNYVAFTGQITSGLYIHHNPAEYAEFMLAAFLHLQGRYGWVPDAIEIILEPDNVTQWSNGTLIGRTIVATAQRLQAHGFTPQFIAPSTSCMGNAVTYFDQLIAVPQAASYVSELAYHRYCGVSAANLQALANRAQTHGVATSMLEWWDAANGYQVLHEDLKAGRNSAWQQGPLSNLNTSGGVGIATVDTSNPSAPVVTTGPLTRYTGQYFQHVRRGARRIGASSTTPTFDPLAFVNSNGGPAVVVKASAGGTFSVQGLPAGTYGIRYTTASASSSHADQTVAAGQSLTTSIPDAGVLTIYDPSTRPSAGLTVTSAVENAGVLTVTWTATAGATSHRLDFLSGPTVVASVAAGAGPSASVGIPAGTHGAFGVRVTALPTGLQSPVFPFMIGQCLPPGRPAVEGAVVEGTAAVWWPPVPGAASYILSAGLEPGGTEYVVPTNIGASTSASASGLPAGFAAWVRVIAVNACGQHGPAQDLFVQ